VKWRVRGVQLSLERVEYLTANFVVVSQDSGGEL
jgi:hypothetical protein